MGMIGPQAAFQLWDQPEVDLLASSLTYQCQLYYILKKTITPRSLELNAFNHLWKFHESYVYPLSALISLVLSKFLAEHVTNQFRLLILVASYWMEAPWFTTVLNILEDVLHWCPIVKDHVIDILVGQVLKGSAIATFNPLAAHRCVAQTRVGDISIYKKCLQAE